MRGKSKPVAAVAAARKMILVKSNGSYEFTRQQGLAAFRRRLRYHKLAELVDHLPDPIRMEMEEIDRTKRKEAAATTSRPKKLA
jgi:tRNA 2-selenouridine synthase SelU